MMVDLFRNDRWYRWFKPLDIALGASEHIQAEVIIVRKLKLWSICCSTGGPVLVCPTREIPLSYP